MQTLRTRIALNDYKVVEKRGPLTIIRWDPVKEVAAVPAKGRARRAKDDKETEIVQKETGYVLASEHVYHGTPSEERLRADIAADLKLRYPEGQAPAIDTATILALL